MENGNVKLDFTKGKRGRKSLPNIMKLKKLQSELTVSNNSFTRINDSIAKLQLQLMVLEKEKVKTKNNVKLLQEEILVVKPLAKEEEKLLIEFRNKVEEKKAKAKANAEERRLKRLSEKANDVAVVENTKEEATEVTKNEENESTETEDLVDETELNIEEVRTPVFLEDSKKSAEARELSDKELDELKLLF